MSAPRDPADKPLVAGARRPRARRRRSTASIRRSASPRRSGGATTAITAPPTCCARACRCACTCCRRRPGPASRSPPPDALYFHHPIGYHHLLTLLVPIFGEHEWLARGVAVAGGLFALWALYALVRAHLVARGRPRRRLRLRRAAGGDVVQRALRSDAAGDGLRALVAERLSSLAARSRRARALARRLRLRARRPHHVGGLLHRPLHRRPRARSTRFTRRGTTLEAGPFQRARPAHLVHRRRLRRADGRSTSGSPSTPACGRTSSTPIASATRRRRRST